MTVGIVAAGWFLKDPPKNWWPREVDPLHWHKHSTRDLQNNPPALRHYTLGQMWRTPPARWVGIQYALYVGCSLFGVAYYVPFAEAKGLGMVGLVGFAGFALTDGGFRPVYGKISEYIGRRRTLYGTATFHWALVFCFGAGLGALAALTLIFGVRRPTEAQMEAAVRAAPEEAETPRPAIA